MFQLSLCVSYKLNLQPGRTFINATMCDYKVTRVRKKRTWYDNLTISSVLCFHEAHEQDVANVEGQCADLAT